ATNMAGFLGPTAAAQEAPVAGYDCRLPETQALQNDDLANPAMRRVELGEELWSQHAAHGHSCQPGHAEPQSRRRGGTRYPPWAGVEARIVSVEQLTNICRTERQEEPAFAYSSDELNGLTGLVMHQSRGLPMSVATDGPAAEAIARGKDYFETRRGQLNLACTSCHVDHVGDRLRGEPISQ